MDLEGAFDMTLISRTAEFVRDAKLSSRSYLLYFAHCSSEPSFRRGAAAGHAPLRWIIRPAPKGQMKTTSINPPTNPKLSKASRVSSLSVVGEDWARVSIVYGPRFCQLSPTAARCDEISAHQAHSSSLPVARP